MSRKVRWGMSRVSAEQRQAAVAVQHVVLAFEVLAADRHAGVADQDLGAVHGERPEKIVG
jgi:hypothetical protein